MSRKRLADRIADSGEKKIKSENLVGKDVEKDDDGDTTDDAFVSEVSEETIQAHKVLTKLLAQANSKVNQAASTLKNVTDPKVIASIDSLHDGLQGFMMALAERKKLVEEKKSSSVNSQGKDTKYMHRVYEDIISKTGPGEDTKSSTQVIELIEQDSWALEHYYTCRCICHLCPNCGGDGGDCCPNNITSACRCDC